MSLLQRIDEYELLVESPKAAIYYNDAQERFMVTTGNKTAKFLYKAWVASAEFMIRLVEQTPSGIHAAVVTACSDIILPDNDAKSFRFINAAGGQLERLNIDEARWVLNHRLLFMLKRYYRATRTVDQEQTLTELEQNLAESTRVRYSIETIRKTLR